MKELTGSFSFKIPEGHPEAGEKIEKEFTYREPENDSEATAIMTEQKWTLVDLVADAVKTRARSNAYQSALLPYRPSEVSQDDIRERIIRDFIRMGKTEQRARELAEQALASE